MVLRSIVFHISWLSTLLKQKVFFSYSFANCEFCFFLSAQFGACFQMAGWKLNICDNQVLNSLLKKWMIDLIYHLLTHVYIHVHYRSFYLIIQELAHEMHYLIPLGSPTGKNKCNDCDYQMYFFFPFSHILKEWLHYLYI